MILFLFEVIKTKPSGRTEFRGAFLVVRVNDFQARMIRLSMYFVGSRNGEGERDCSLINLSFFFSHQAGEIAVYAQFEGAIRIVEQKRNPNVPADRH
jgi:hypothetical protein